MLRTLAAGLLLCAPLSHAEEAWQAALPGWVYAFPRDHFSHPAFKTEWWYLTGNLFTKEGRRFGYQATFFRQGLLPSSELHSGQSRFIVADLKFAHCAVTDMGGQRFHYVQKVSRGAFGEAGIGVFDLPSAAPSAIDETGAKAEPNRLAWIEDWKLTRAGVDGFQVTGATAADVQFALRLDSSKPWAIHGERGVSQKAEGVGHASHYYSGTRLPTSGTMQIEGRTMEVQGESWFDHEWATNQLTAEQVGWNWFSLQFANGTELMLYQMRTRDGGIDATSSGTSIDADGRTRHLRRDDYTLIPLAFWTSNTTQARYPIEWQLTVPSLSLNTRITTPVQNQELALPAISYWEGVIDVAASAGKAGSQGHGYMELTGYAGPLTGLDTASP